MPHTRNSRELSFSTSLRGRVDDDDDDHIDSLLGPSTSESTSALTVRASFDDRLGHASERGDGYESGTTSIADVVTRPSSRAAKEPSPMPSMASVQSARPTTRGGDGGENLPLNGLYHHSDDIASDLTHRRHRDSPGPTRHDCSPLPMRHSPHPEAMSDLTTSRYDMSATTTSVPAPLPPLTAGELEQRVLQLERHLAATKAQSVQVYERLLETEANCFKLAALARKAELERDTEMALKKETEQRLARALGMIEEISGDAARRKLEVDVDDDEHVEGEVDRLLEMMMSSVNEGEENTSGDQGRNGEGDGPSSRIVVDGHGVSLGMSLDEVSGDNGRAPYRSLKSRLEKSHPELGVGELSWNEVEDLVARASS